MYIRQQSMSPISMMADLHVREKKLARVAPLSGPSVTIIILWPCHRDYKRIEGAL